MTTATKPRLTVEEIRRLYPNPIEATVEEAQSRDAYCVGGALCRARGMEAATFPGIWPVSIHLLDENPDLPENAAKEFAGRIVELNDAGDFDAAWGALRDALAYTAVTP